MISILYRLTYYYNLSFMQWKLEFMLEMIDYQIETNIYLKTNTF